MDQDGIIAIGLLTRRDLNLLGPTFDRLWPIEKFRIDDPDGTSTFDMLLRAIDEAEAEPGLIRDRGESER